MRPGARLLASSPSPAPQGGRRRSHHWTRPAGQRTTGALPWPVPARACRVWGGVVRSTCMCGVGCAASHASCTELRSARHCARHCPSCVSCSAGASCRWCPRPPPLRIAASRRGVPHARRLRSAGGCIAPAATKHGSIPAVAARCACSATALLRSLAPALTGHPELLSGSQQLTHWLIPAVGTQRLYSRAGRLWGLWGGRPLSRSRRLGLRISFCVGTDAQAIASITQQGLVPS